MTKKGFRCNTLSTDWKEEIRSLAMDFCLYDSRLDRLTVNRIIFAVEKAYPGLDNDSLYNKAVKKLWDMYDKRYMTA